MSINRNLSFLAEGASSSGVLSVTKGGTGLTTLTAGYIPYGNGTSALSSSSSLYFDGTNLGVGTSSPTTKIQVSGAAAPVIRATDTRNTVNLDMQPANTEAYFGTSSNHPLAFQTNATERMRIDSSGNLLVGTTTHYNYSAGTTEIVVGTTGTGTTSGGAITFASGNGLIGYLGAQEANTTLGTNTATPLTFATTNIERGRFSAAGGFSVGTTTDPGAGLISDQYGNVRSLPLNSQTSAYVVAASDNGKVISITTGGVTINNSIMSAGMVVTIYNNSGSSQTITQGTGVTLQWAGQSSSTTGNRTLGLYGMATVYFLSASSAVITGSGLT